MLTPSEIRKRADRHYRKVLKDWQNAADFFPYEIPVGSFQGMNAGEIQSAITALKVNPAYELRWTTRNFRDHGKNSFPTHIVFSDCDAFLAYLEKEGEFEHYEMVLNLFVECFPESRSFFQSHLALTLRSLPHLMDVLKVLRWRYGNPEKYCFLREIPALPHSKFIEDHRALFSGLFEAILPEDYIDPNERELERRFGFKKREHFFVCRLLQADLLEWPARELALHPDDLATLTHDKIRRVIIVENQVSLHTLPDQESTLAIHGSGYAVLRLKKARWLKKVSLIYRGDLDENGFQILSQLRGYFPKIQSQQMDPKTIRQSRHLASIGKRSPALELPNLTKKEAIAYRWTRRYQVSIEQERIS